MNTRLQRHQGTTFLLVTFLFYLAQYMYAPFLTPYVGVLGGSLAMTGLVASAYGALQLVLRIPFGLWSDHLDRRKPFIIAGTALAGLSALGMGWVDTPRQLLWFRALSGVGASTWAAFTVFYAGLFPAREAGKRMGLLICAASSGQLAGNLLGGFFAEHGGWRAPFLLAALPGLLAAAITVTLTESRQKSPPQDEGGVRHRPPFQEVVHRNIIEPSLLSLLTHFIFYATVLGFTPVYVTKLGFSRLALGLLGTLGGAAYVVGTLLATKAEALGLPWRSTIAVSLATMALATLVTPWARTFLTMSLVFILLGLCRGTTYPVSTAAVLRAAPPGSSATAIGLFQAIYAIGMFAGPALAGLLAQWLGLTFVFYFCGVLCLAGLLWCATARHFLKRSEPGQVRNSAVCD